MRTEAEKQAIRLKNTLLAAAGGAVLTGMLVLAYINHQVVVTGSVLAFAIGAFWLVNIGFITTISSGFNLRFKDPGLSLPQMYWASSCTMVAIAISQSLEQAAYPLILLTIVFGVFRVSVGAVNLFCVYVGVGIFLTQAIRVWLLGTAENTATLWAGGSSFVFCAIGLTLLCDSLVTLRNRLRQQNEQLKHALAAKSYFLANMSHEIRTPMNGVLGMLDVALAEPITDEQRQYLSVAYSSAKSLLDIINDILDFSKMETGKMTLKPSPVSVEHEIADVLVSFKAQASKKNIALLMEVEPQLAAPVLLDPLRFRQILNNLIGNAVKFTTAGEIKVSARMRDDQTLCLRVRDTGMGIAPENHGELFDAFTQVDASSTRSYSGTGLGLAITRQLAQLMGGDVSVNSRLGEGSEFSVSLKVSHVVDGPQTDTPDLSNRNILVVDDSESSGLAMTKQLAQFGARVYFCRGADEALNLLIKDDKRFDLALLDADLAPVNGMDLPRQLHARLPQLSPKLVVVNQSFTDSDARASAPFGVSAWLSQPLGALALAREVRAVLSNRASLESERSAAIDDIREPKILLVEDNHTNQKVAQVAIEALGFRVDVANDGQQALAMINESIELKRPYGLILMDCQMPVMDGFEATRHIRKSSNSRMTNVPIIAMTANAQTGDREKCLRAGMNDYLAKPINAELLEHTLNYWLNDRPPLIYAQDQWAGFVQPPTLCWDRRALFTLVRYKLDRMTHLIEVFLRDSQGIHKRLDDALQCEDLAAISKAAHGLKGASANVGACALPALLERLEDAIVLNRTEQLGELRSELAVELERLHNQMRHFLEDPQMSH